MRTRTRPRGGGHKARVAAGILAASLALGCAFSACGSSSEDDASSGAESTAECAAELTELRVSDVDNVVGCGDAVILREKDLNAEYPKFNWSEDSGEVNEPIGSVEIFGPKDCGSPAEEVDVIGAQVVELKGFFGGGEESTLWQDVVVLENSEDAERVYLSQMSLVECGEDIDRISPDGNFGGSLSPPIEVLEETGDYAVLSDEFEEALVLMHGGQYYTQLWLDPSWLENGMADRFIEMAADRLARANS